MGGGFEGIKEDSHSRISFANLRREIVLNIFFLILRKKLIENERERDKS